jgi:hypothetical protein
MVAPGIFSVPVHQTVVAQFSWVAIPEPSSFGLVLLGLFLVVKGNRKRLGFQSVVS